MTHRLPDSDILPERKHGTFFSNHLTPSKRYANSSELTDFGSQDRFSSVSKDS